MFNPQRKSKVVDIFMQQKSYKLHLSKMHEIEKSGPLRSKRYQQQEQQQHYLDRLEKSKKQIKDRYSSDVRRENTRLMRKLVQTDQRKEFNPERKSTEPRHFNSYFSMKRERQRIHKDNYTLVMRMDTKAPEIPSLRDLKKEYRQSRKFAKNCRKLPSIVKHEDDIKKKLSQPSFESRVQSTKRLNP